MGVAVNSTLQPQISHDPYARTDPPSLTLPRKGGKVEATPVQGLRASAGSAPTTVSTGRGFFGARRFERPSHWPRRSR